MAAPVESTAEVQRVLTDYKAGRGQVRSAADRTILDNAVSAYLKSLGVPPADIPGLMT